MTFEEQLKDFIRKTAGDALVREEYFRGDLSFYILPEALYDLCQAFLVDHTLGVNSLRDITSVDWYGHDDEVTAGRFEVVYNFYSLKHKARFFVKVRLSESKPEIASLTPLLNAANWLEREVWDMMGIAFKGHPDLTKILTPDDLEGHPLRRDFPLTWEQPRFSWNKDDPPEVIK
jgi:NADH-quinone oxidoreductase subunit C